MRLKKWYCKVGVTGAFAPTYEFGIEAESLREAKDMAMATVQGIEADPLLLGIVEVAPFNFVLDNQNWEGSDEN